MKEKGKPSFLQSSVEDLGKIPIFGDNNDFEQVLVKVDNLLRIFDCNSFRKDNGWQTSTVGI